MAMIKVKNMRLSLTLGRLVLAVIAVTLYGCDVGSTTSDISSAAPSTATCNTSSYPDKMNTYSSRLSKYKNDGQCSPQIQAAESYRQAAIANCSAGSTSGATGNYEYYTKSLAIVNSMCP